MRILLPVLLAAMAAQAEDPQADPGPLQIAYEEYEPFFMAGPGGKVSGVYGALAMRTFRAAGIETQWQRVSFNRLMRLLAQKERPVCAVGYGHAQERSRFARVSNLFIKGAPSVLVARPQAAEKMQQLGTFEGVIADTSLRGAFVDAPESHGYFADAPEAKRGHLFITAEDNRFFEMVASGRADYTMLNRETAAYLIDQHAGGDMEAVTLDGLPKTTDRFILCSRAVSEATMTRINAGIAEVAASDAR